MLFAELTTRCCGPVIRRDMAKIDIATTQMPRMTLAPSVDTCCELTGFIDNSRQHCLSVNRDLLYIIFIFPANEANVIENWCYDWVCQWELRIG